MTERLKKKLLTLYKDSSHAYCPPVKHPNHPKRCPGRFSNPPDPSRAYFFSVAEYLELSVAENPQNVKAAFTSQLVDFQ